MEGTGSVTSPALPGRCGRFYRKYDEDFKQGAVALVV
jgi:hypothetical protein